MGNCQHLLQPRPLPALVSFVIPVYNEEEMLPLLVERLQTVMGQLPTRSEVILVNDGSSDSTLVKLRDITVRDRRFKGISLARNFGHQIAATAGLDAAQGDAVVLIDADLQDPPELVVDMLAEYQNGYDVIYAQRVRREGETLFKRCTAWLFYRVMRTLVYKDLPPDVGDFRMMSRPCLDALNSMRETHRFLRGMVSWVGFAQTSVPFVRQRRAAGETKYPLSRMLKFAWTAAISFSPVPLRMSFVFGAVLFGVGLVYSVYAIARLFLGLHLVPGWTSLIVMNLLTAGAIMIAIGVLGEYVARIFEEIKDRPLYTVAHHFNCGSNEDESAPEAVPHRSASNAP